MRRTNRNRGDTVVGKECVLSEKRMCDKDTTEFSNLEALDGRWGYFYVASGS